MKKMTTTDWIAFVLVAIGGLSWGLIGIFNWDVVQVIFGGTATDPATISRIIYTIVGIATLWRIYTVTASKE